MEVHCVSGSLRQRCFTAYPQPASGAAQGSSAHSAGASCHGCASEHVNLKRRRGGPPVRVSGEAKLRWLTAAGYV